MVTKLAVLLLAGACLGFPVDEVKPPASEPIAPIPEGPISPSQSLQVTPPGPEAPIGGPIPAGAPTPTGAPIPAGAPIPGDLVHSSPPQALPIPEGGKIENDDLKTDSSFWWRRSYYPIYYSKYYYRPRSYRTYSYYPSYYSWWNSYW